LADRQPAALAPSPAHPQVALLIAGAKERGELENRVTRLLAEAKEDRDVILM
jgi:ATP-dependent Clp protease ATP-binding subunit ClpA